MFTYKIFFKYLLEISETRYLNLQVSTDCALNTHLFCDFRCIYLCTLSTLVFKMLQLDIEFPIEW